jgi:two-component system sensor histidine kinase KdpD
MSEASRSPVRRGGTSWPLAVRRELLAEPAGYAVGALVTTLATVLALLAAPYATLAHVMVIYLLGAVLVATRYGMAVSSVTVLASALCFDYFNIPPVFAFALPDVDSVLTFCGMLVTAIAVCSLVQRLRYQRTVARASEARTLALCELSLDLSETSRASELPRVAERHLVCLFGPVTRVVVRRSEADLLDAVSGAEREVARGASDARELCVRELEHTLLGFQPIASGAELLGLIRVELSHADSKHEREQRVLLAACADRIAVAIDRLVLGDAARRAQVEAEAEHLRNELLSAMSHDLRTPLASILTAGTTLMGRASEPDSVRDELLETIVEETERLNRLVTNLLNVTRLESGKVRLNKEPEALDDLLASVLSRLSGRLEGRAVTVTCPSELPFVSMDPVLVDQVLVNLIENVLRYTPVGSPLAIAVHATEAELVVRVADRGPGIAEAERDKVFEKFYRGAQARLKDGGSGLGLTICRAVARAHGGRIEIHARTGGGATVEFALPVSAPSDGQPPAPSLTETREVHA